MKPGMPRATPRRPKGGSASAANRLGSRLRAQTRKVLAKHYRAKYGVR